MTLGWGQPKVIFNSLPKLLPHLHFCFGDHIRRSPSGQLVPVYSFRRSLGQPNLKGLPLQLHIIADVHQQAATSKQDLPTTTPSSCLHNGGFEQDLVWFHPLKLPWDAWKILPEVEAEDPTAWAKARCSHFTLTTFTFTFSQWGAAVAFLPVHIGLVNRS